MPANVCVLNQLVISSFISIDDEKGMYTAAQHLINLGHKHIVYPCSEAAGLASSIDARAQGFINACKDAEGKHDIN